MWQRNQNTLTDNQRRVLRSCMGSWPISRFDFSKPFTRPISETTPRWTEPAEFIAGAQIAMPYGDGAALVPFDLWPAQRDVLARMQVERLLVLLKARQIGMTWLTCAYVLERCMARAGRTVLMLSQGQLEANELIDRIRLMHATHADPALPPLVTDNTTELEWANGSRVKSLPATRRAGRSFTASIVVLDEFAFMQWGTALLSAVKPTIDNGGQLIILSSADGQGSGFHQFWQAAVSGRNGYTPLFLGWQANPTRGDGWREARKVEALDVTEVLREYPENDIEAFSAATGQVYDVWSDGPPDGNVTEAADYVPGGGEVLWACDDGYEGAIDATTGQYTAKSSPRVFLLVQHRADGQLCVFAEHYRVKVQQEDQIQDVLALPYPKPEYAVVDSASADLRDRLRYGADIGVFGKPGSIAESIKTTRRMLAPDLNGRRRVLVHPRCAHLRYELASYRMNDKGDPIDERNHGPDALRYLCWHMRIE